MTARSGLQAYRDRVAREKRDAALDAAVDLFLEDGYDRTSLEAVARRAGVSSATLYKHFPTKAALFGGVMARLWETDGRSDSDPLAIGDPRRGLGRIGDDYAELLQRPKTVALFRLIIAETQRSPELGRELYERGKKPYLDRLRDYLQAEIAAGTLTIDDVPLATRQFLGMINDIVFWPRLLIVDLEITVEESRNVVEAAVATFLARYQARETR